MRHVRPLAPFNRFAVMARREARRLPCGGCEAHRKLDRRVARPRAERADKKAADYGREIAKLQADGVTSLWTMASGTQRATRQDAARQWRVASRTGEPSAASRALGG